MEVYQQQIDMEKLCHQGELLLKKVSDQTDRDMIQEPLTELRHLWENLGDKITHRQVIEPHVAAVWLKTHNLLRTASGRLYSVADLQLLPHCFPWESKLLVFVGILEDFMCLTAAFHYSSNI